MKRIPHRIFAEEFKKESVRLYKEQGLTRAEVSRIDITVILKSAKRNSGNWCATLRWIVLR